MKSDNSLRVSMAQLPMKWKKPKENLKSFEEVLGAQKGKTDLIVFPEAFTTGFTMDVEEVADSMDGETLSWLRRQASSGNFALMGSFLVEDGGHYFNRGFFVYPNEEVVFYDKRHLFRMAEEHKYYTAGDKRVIVFYKGWNICLQICYDLRFPVWSRNVHNEYDLLLYAANWPVPRRSVWHQLLLSRAIENICYVCGVNLVGVNDQGLVFDGGSQIISPKGKLLLNMEDQFGISEPCVLDLEALQTFRKKFPAWEDADSFELL